MHTSYRQVNGELIIDYEYTIFTNTTQNMTLAIVYPSQNAGSYVYFSTTAEIRVKLNSSEIDYETLSWADLGWNSSDYDEYNFDGDWIFDSLYAVLDLTLLQNTTSTIEFNVEDEARRVDFFTLNHFVGSARTFDSDSHQRIHVEIIDDDNLLSSTSFEPSNFRTTNIYNSTTEAIWEFNISEIGFDSIDIDLTFRIYHPPDNWIGFIITTPLGQILIVISGIFTLVAIVFWYKRRHQ